MPQRGEPIWRRYARFVRPDVGADVDEELEHHLAMRAAEFERRGMSREDARRASLARFGDVERIAEWLRSHDHSRQRTKGRRERIDMFMQQLRHATRSLTRQPVFSASAILTLAFGIGATTAIFAVVNAVLLAPLPYSQPDRLVSLSLTSSYFQLLGQSHASFEALRRLSRVTTDIGLHYATALNVTDGVTPVRMQADSVTSGVFSALRLTPRLGRLFTPDDERSGHTPVTIISEGMWRERFDADRSVIGRSIHIDGRRHEIVGVLPATMQFPREDVSLWLPLDLSDADPAPIALRYESIARLRDGVSLETAERNLQPILGRMGEFFAVAVPGIPMTKWIELVKPRVVVRSLRDSMVGDVAPVLWVMLATIVFVLLAACTNIATLFLVRAEGRARELAVRSALGASRVDAISRFFAEGVLVSTLGGVLGVASAYAALGALRRTTALPLPRLGEIAIDSHVLIASIVVTALVALFICALPILRFGRRDLSPLLRAGGRNATSGRERRRLQGGLVMAQVALAFVLLSASGLMARTFVSLQRVKPGIDVDNSIAFRVALPRATYRSDTAVAQFYQRLQERLASIPGMDNVGATSWLPLEREGTNVATLWREDMQLGANEVAPTLPQMIVSPSYFRTIGIPLVAGRTFRELPPGTRSDEAIVTLAYAEQNWGSGGAARALGKRIRFLPDAGWITIVGVVGDVHQEGLDRPASPAVYLPLHSSAYGTLSSQPSDVAVVLRTRSAPEGVTATIRREVAALDPTLPVYHLRVMRDVIWQSMARTSMTAFMLVIAAVVAVSLGAIGLYGVVSYTVEMRTREIGLRLALGEPPSQLVGRFAREGTILAVVGVVIGLGGALFLTRILRGMLYGVGPNDPLMLGSAAGVLVLTALMASWIPAHRASRLDPALVIGGE